MVIRLRRLPMPLRVLCVLLAVLLLAGTVFVPVARAEALTATIALFGGAALVSGVLAAAGLKASDSAAWISWCSQIAASDSVRSAAQALTKITLPAAKLVALVYAGKTYVSRALQRAIINEAITAGAYVADSSASVIPPAGYAHYGAIPRYNSIAMPNVVSPGIVWRPNITASSAIYYTWLIGTDCAYLIIASSSTFSGRIIEYNLDGSIGSSGPANSTYGRTYNGQSVDYCYSFYNAKYTDYSAYTPAVTLPYGYDYYRIGRNTPTDIIGDIAYISVYGSAGASTGGVDGVTQQEGAITDPIGKDVIGSLDDLKTKVTDWSDYLDTGVDVAIDGAAEGVASEAVPSLPVTIPTTGQQGVQTYPDARTGTTDSTVIDTGTDTATVSENQSVVSKLLSDVVDYIQPDTGFFSKFPLCIPYDVYLFFSALSGKDMSNNSIFSSTPGSLGISNTAELDILAADQWEPVLDIDQDWSISGFTIPFHIHLDFTSFQPVFDLIRVSIGAFFVFDLIIYEWNRTRGE